MNGDQEYQRYHGIFAWHPEKKSLYQINFSYDGSIGETLIEMPDRDTMKIGYTPFHEGSPKTCAKQSSSSITIRSSGPYS